MDISDHLHGSAALPPVSIEYEAEMGPAWTLCS
jgi:hypothetical protein